MASATPTPSTNSTESETAIRIVGGQIAKQGQFPYQVSLQCQPGPQYQFSHICGGSIIDRRTILTAGHCCNLDPSVDINMEDDCRIVAGEQDLTVNSGLEQAVGIYRAYLHPNYEVLASGGVKNDICVLELESNLAFSINVDSIPLDNQPPSIGQNCDISGWGTTSFGSSQVSDVLRYAQVPILSDSYCAKKYQGYDDSVMLCAGILVGGVDTCQGDSGGPLVCSGNLTGVVSYGYRCAEPSYPGVYTEVVAFVDWVNVQRSAASNIVLSTGSMFTMLIFAMLAVYPN